jgi:hypothetical protein
MAKMDYGKARRCELWRESARTAWSGGVPSIFQRASARQIDYVQLLLKKLGRRPLAPAELAKLTVASASRLIETLKGG